MNSWDPMTQMFIFGLLGGGLAELAGLFKLRHEAPTGLPIWIKSPWYWCITSLMALAGGVLVVVYAKSGIDLKPIIAVNIGASAPLIISTLVSQAARQTESTNNVGKTWRFLRLSTLVGERGRAKIN